MRGKRRSRILPWVGGGIVALLLAGVIGIVVWSQVGVMAAEREPLESVLDDPAIEADERDEAIVLSPASDPADVGLVFIPGAKVEPSAYAARLSGLVHDGITVVITRPTLNLAFFDFRPLETFTSLEPDVDRWIVGGHSLGGVRACQLAVDADALALFASYCSNDLSESGLPVLSLAGSEDGLSTPEKIADARELLPDDAEMVEIQGASHASFGDYGAQAGDDEPTIDDADMTDRIAELVGAFSAGLG